jgi:hypothetical protein
MAMMMMGGVPPDVPPPTLAPAAPKLLMVRLYVNLAETSEVNYKELLLKKGRVAQVRTPSQEQAMCEEDGGGGSASESDAVSVGGGASDYYDSQDSFIDDADLEDQIQQKLDNKTETVHSGFFAHSGALETVRKPEDEEVSGAQNGKRKADEWQDTNKGKKPKKKVDPRTRFLVEHGESIKDWNPGTEVMAAVTELREAAKTTLKEGAKHFPTELDGPLRKVDKIVVQSHPKNHRINAYFACLMEFLPFSKNVLKAAMQRLEKYEVVENADAVLQKHLRQLEMHVKRLIELHGVPKQASPSAPGAAEDSATATAAAAKTTVKFDIPLKEVLYEAVLALEAKVVAFNECRKTSKAPGNKTVDSGELKDRVEKNKLFEKIAAYWPQGAVDKADVRKAYDLERRRQKNKAKKAAEKENPSMSGIPPTIGGGSPSVGSSSMGGVVGLDDRVAPVASQQVLPTAAAAAAATAGGAGAASTSSAAAGAGRANFTSAGPTQPVVPPPAAAKKSNRPPKTSTFHPVPQFRNADFRLSASPAARPSVLL